MICGFSAAADSQGTVKKESALAIFKAFQFTSRGLKRTKAKHKALADIPRAVLKTKGRGKTEDYCRGVGLIMKSRVTNVNAHHSRNAIELDKVLNVRSQQCPVLAQSTDVRLGQHPYGTVSLMIQFFFAVVTSRCDLTFDPLTLNVCYIGCDVFKLCTELEKNRTIL